MAPAVWRWAHFVESLTLNCNHIATDFNFTTPAALAPIGGFILSDASAVFCPLRSGAERVIRHGGCVVRQGWDREFTGGRPADAPSVRPASAPQSAGVVADNVISISPASSAWQSLPLSQDPSRSFGHDFNGHLFHWVSRLNSNRISLLGASVSATLSVMVAQSLSMINDVIVPLVLLVPAILFAHIAARQMGQLALTRRIWLFMPVFVLAFLPTLVVSFFVAGKVGLLGVISAGLGAFAWYVISELLLERYCPRRYGLVGEWSVLTLPTDQRSMFRRLRPASNLDGLHGVVVASSLQEQSRFQNLVQRAALRGIQIMSLPVFEERMLGRAPEAALVSEPYLHAPAPTYLKLRRLADLALALLLLPIFSLIIAISCIVIRAESPGPAIFRQTRVGQRRKPFTCYKLRTMRTGVVGTAFTGEVDPRITRFGRLLRKWRIDEFPQIYNVLRGDMSWIGPRPESIPLAAEYRRHIPHYSYRYLVPPGITGWAAVHQGNVGEVEAARTKLQYDFYYIRNLSFWMDLLVVLKTIRTVLTGFGSR